MADLKVKARGIILAGGAGSRLHPATSVTAKSLLAVYDKPMIYYPLATLISMGLTKILIIAVTSELDRHSRLLGDGSHLGLKLSYAEQTDPKGIPQAFTIGSDFIGKGNVVLILGDNLFLGQHDFASDLKQFKKGAMVFACPVQHAEDSGVIEFDPAGKVISIVEKPHHPKSKYAVAGLYVYDSSVVEIARGLTPSARGELEIADVNNSYLAQDALQVVRLETQSEHWIDAGTPQRLLDASSLVASTLAKSGCNLGVIEEASLRAGLIDRNKLLDIARQMTHNAYRTYLEKLASSD